MSEFDAIVTGAGPAGLSAACLLALDGRRVALVAKDHADATDPRTVALMLPSIRLLMHLGLWPGQLKEATQPLRKLRLIDDTGSLFKAPTITFDPAELGEEAFGWNFPLGILITALFSRAQELGVTFTGADAASVHTGAGSVSVTTTDGQRLTARVALAADGRNSLLREAAGIRTNRWSYDQTALATSFTHSGPHDGISTEHHKTAGPFTTVPMPGNRSALVWMERPARAAELMELSGRELAAEIQIGAHGALGLVSDIGARRLFPMQGLVARDFARNRIMLIGEAAHVVPPIGAQGLNMSLRDAAEAAGLMEGEDDPGAPAILADYDAMRRRDVQPRQQVIDLMNRSLLSGFMALETGRAMGLTLLSQFGPLRRAAMQYGLAPSSNLPRAMRAAPSGPARLAN
ncbi:MAG: FAD-dependent monooxygenase [Aestuariivirga sp.]|uniref:FAD-dependent monooxygenase n=1 Tax=Aestuariivirga sp. TaxID=2650926 RepID=UPI0025BE21A0|nr:FAD-dependent monooxygenase [Aestuariivirga sp.]MCA3562597.1 FAD-dependent monooxygenase [Aestuariivirga sp.]